MKSNKLPKYLQIGLTAFVVLALTVALVFFMIEGARVKKIIDMIISILMPIIYGAVMAYLLAPVFNKVRFWVLTLQKKLTKSDTGGEGLARVVATAASVIMLTIVVVGLFSMLLPQLITSIIGIMEALPSSARNLQSWLEQILVNNPEVETYIMTYYDRVITYLQTWSSEELMPNIYNIISGLSIGIYNLLIALKNVLIGVIVMVYLLNMKEKLTTQAKMIIYSAFPLAVANKVVEEFRYAHKIFGGFIIGKLLDSLIIGIMSFVLLNIMNMPYVLLISVIIGVTNVIPFFGPFIGAIPSAFLILLVSPMKCLYFIIFIFLLQQFDGNILGPKILGDSTGLSSFWVLFSILLFGGLFGFAGMIVGVPAFAVIYRLVTELVTHLLRKKQLSADIGSYANLDHIDSDSKRYVKNEGHE
ncbi:MAG: AI-2E family transporter [Lachnospiraceae bacterium]